MNRWAIFFSLLALPVAAWAVYNGRVLPGTVSEPRLQHFGIHVRFLLALLLLFVDEKGSQGMITRSLHEKIIPIFI